MMAYTVLAGCTACGACLPTCPERCLRPAPAGSAVPLLVLTDLCTGCGECAEVCPAEAIRPLTELVATPEPPEPPLRSTALEAGQ